MQIIFTFSVLSNYKKDYEHIFIFPVRCDMAFIEPMHHDKPNMILLTLLCHVSYKKYVNLTHWGRETHICVGKLTIIGSDDGLSPGRRQAIILTNAGILLIGPLETNFNEILIEIHTFSFKKMHLKKSSAKRRPFCFGLNVLRGKKKHELLHFQV